MPMTDNAARRLWLSLEPLHDVVYFGPGVRDAGVGLGLRGYWMTYFAFRAAPLGAVGPAAVVAAFAGFAPGMVARALPDAWSRASPQVCLTRRAEVSAEALRAISVDPDACGAAAGLLAPVAAAADATGRALFAANAALPMPDDPVAAFWQVATTLREHRGDGHVAALVVAGISGLEAHLLQTAAGRFPAEVIRLARGWTEQDWAGAAGRLRARGLLTGDAEPLLTAAGRALLAGIEMRTDDAAWAGGLAALGEPAVDEVVATLRTSVDAVLASGVLPADNPTGLPAGPGPA
ncbi:MAG TPA: hypothetical protein VLW50_03615 [Streptosporangiaceae bacterium]|nr:hypothetical protein [Streptosporangiaceae bacterium]